MRSPLRASCSAPAPSASWALAACLADAAMHDARCCHAAAARAPMGLGDLQEEVTLHICGFLSVRELGRLACASRRFGRPSDWPITAGGPVVARRSLVDEAARRWVLACSFKSIPLRIFSHILTFKE